MRRFFSALISLAALVVLAFEFGNKIPDGVQIISMVGISYTILIIAAVYFVGISVFKLLK